jgi:hypothetical protein
MENDMQEKSYMNPPAAQGVRGIQSTDRPVEEPRVFEHTNADGDVVMLTKSEITAIEKEQRSARHEAKLQLAEDLLMADWGAEMDNRGIMFDGDLPKDRSKRIDLVCGCKHKAKFRANVKQLSQLKKRDETYCPRCHVLSKPDNLEKVVKAKGGTLLSKYVASTKRVRVDCGKGHAFQATPANLTKKDGGSWCPHCKGVRTSGEERLREILAERGSELVSYGDHASAQLKDVLDPYGDVLRRGHSQLIATPPTFGTLRGERKVRIFFDEDSMRCFVLIDEIPPNLPQALVDIIAMDDFEEVGVLGTIVECYELLAETIATYTGESDFKCVNVLRNPEWVSPGVYTWGTFPVFDGTLVSTADAVPS